MAKDGTSRGGARAGAGRKKKDLTDRILEGKTASIINLPEAPELEGVQMPEIKSFMTDEQRMGTLCAAEIYQETWQWLRDRGVLNIVNPQLIEQYAMSAARWIQLEQITSEYGFISKHPTTGAAIASPFVSMAQAYNKQTQQLWYQIFQLVKENCSTPFSGTPQDDVMERLLSECGC